MGGFKNLIMNYGINRNKTASWAYPVYVSDEDITELIKFICLELDEEFEDVMSKKRFRNLVDVRSVCYYYLHVIFKLTYNDIGKVFKRHHATIIHGYELFKDITKFDFNENSLRLIRKHALDLFENSHEYKKSIYMDYQWLKRTA